MEYIETTFTTTHIHIQYTPPYTYTLYNPYTYTEYNPYKLLYCNIKVLQHKDIMKM